MEAINPSFGGDVFYRYQRAKARVVWVGGRTELPNLKEICAYLNRDPCLLLRWIGVYLGAQTSVDRKAGYQRYFVNGQWSVADIEKAVNDFAQACVICGLCGNPESNLFRDGNALMLNCFACGLSSIVTNKYLHRWCK